MSEIEQHANSSDRVGGWHKFSVDRGWYRGVNTKIHFQDNSVIVEKSTDVSKALKLAAEERARNAGKRFTEQEQFRRVGHIPQHIFAKMLIEGWAHDERAVSKWLAENPAFICDERYAK